MAAPHMRPRSARRFALGLACIATLAGCEKAGSRGDGIQDIPVAATLNATVLYDGDALAKPSSAAVVGPWLVVADHGGGPMLHVIDRAGRRLAGSWGRQGGGPGEFRSTASLQPASIPGHAWVFDGALGRLTLLDLSKIANNSGDPVRRIVTLRADAIPIDVRWAADTELVSTGLFPRGRLAMFDSAGRLRTTAGPLPPARAGVPAQVLQHAYTGTLARHPSRGLLAIATRHADRLEIYRRDGTLLHATRGPSGFEPVYHVVIAAGAPTMATGEDLRFGYVDLAAAGDRLFALYSGHTRAERPGRANFGDEVHVFDWNGRLLARYRLDQPALTLAVDAPTRTLYAVRHDPAPAVVSYTLPSEAF